MEYLKTKLIRFALIQQNLEQRFCRLQHQENVLLQIHFIAIAQSSETCYIFTFS